MQKRERLRAACGSLGWDEPQTGPAFVQLAAAAKQRVLQAGSHAAELEERKDKVKAKRREQEAEFQGLRDEIFAIERQRSNIPARMLALRAAMASELGLADEDLPFAGELLQVRQDAAGWEGAFETQDRLNEDVRHFKHSLKQALSHASPAAHAGSDAAALAERRFENLRLLVTRLSSQDSVDRNWRNLVLDVRQHVEFVVRELDEEQREVEVYAGGAGRSGGQRQKLAAKCLAAALRYYQLGGQERSMPIFSTVVLDEAFDKADAEFTTMAMNIFKNFGFQMVVATPLKSVMTLEPFIGGACFVHIRDRKTSAVVPIAYDADQKRLKLPALSSEPFTLGARDRHSPIWAQPHGPAVWRP